MYGNRNKTHRTKPVFLGSFWSIVMSRCSSLKNKQFTLECSVQCALKMIDH